MAKKGSSLSQTKGGIYGDVGSGLTTVGEAAALDMVRDTSTSNPWAQDKLNRWDNTAKVGLEMRPDQGARNRLEGSKTKLVSARLFPHFEPKKGFLKKAKPKFAFG